MSNESTLIKPSSAASVPHEPASMRSEIWRAWQRLLLALNELAVHMVGALAVVASIEIVNLAVSTMTNENGVVFFRGVPYLELPARWLFDAADVGILLAILYRGVVVMWKVYREPNND